MGVPGPTVGWGLINTVLQALRLPEIYKEKGVSNLEIHFVFFMNEFREGTYPAILKKFPTSRVRYLFQ